MALHKIFLDEAGNTGSRLIDSQPFLTMVAIGLPDKKLPKVIAALDAVKTREKIGELHAKNLKPWRRSRIAKELLEILMKEKMFLFIGICEKRFVISTFIDDDFLDPVYNGNCDNSFTHPEGKRDRADLIHQHLTDEAAIACNKLFQKGEGGDRAFELVLNCLKGTNLYDLMSGLRVSEIEEIIRDLNCNPTEHSMKRGVLKSPNFFTILGLFSKMEVNYRTIDIEAEVIFDSSPQYNSSFLVFFELLKKATPTVMDFGKEIPHVFGYTHLKKFRTESSEANPVLQIADVVATSINDLMTKLSKSDKPPILEASERFLLWLTLEQWNRFDNRFCDYVISVQQHKRIWEALVINAPTEPS